MPRFLIAVALIGCHHAAPSAERCPDSTPYDIKSGACTSPAPTECHGLCGVVVARGLCVALPHALVAVAGKEVRTNDAGQFDIAIPAGHFQLRVRAQGDAFFTELDVTGQPQTLAPLELVFPERACGCGGACPN